MQKFVPLKKYLSKTESEMLELSNKLNAIMQQRRTVREYDLKQVPDKVILNCIKAASSSPSGAHKQPWHFVIVKDKKIKSIIREEAEKEEKEFYNGKASEEWLNDLKPFATNEDKPFLEEAPVLIVIFEEKHTIDEKNNIRKNYYTKESVGIATGMLITALHYSGIATLTHTPSPMNFLNKILNRPKNEKPFLILVTGYPKKGTLVPDIKRKSIEEVTTII